MVCPLNLLKRQDEGIDVPRWQIHENPHILRNRNVGTDVLFELYHLLEFPYKYRGWPEFFMLSMYCGYTGLMLMRNLHTDTKRFFTTFLKFFTDSLLTNT